MPVYMRACGGTYRQCAVCVRRFVGNLKCAIDLLRQLRKLRIQQDAIADGRLDEALESDQKI